MSIRWTKAALASVDEIAGFIAKDNPNRATSFVLELQAAGINWGHKLRSDPNCFAAWSVSRALTDGLPQKQHLHRG
jgi:hypothetical protein